MKSTSAVALMIGMWVLSGWGGNITQAAEPRQRSSFQQWCLQRASLSTEVIITVEVLLAEAGTSDYERAAKTLSNRKEQNQLALSVLSIVGRAKRFVSGAIATTKNPRAITNHPLDLIV